MFGGRALPGPAGGAPRPPSRYKGDEKEEKGWE